MIDAWTNAADPAFWEGWLTFDAIRYAPMLKEPLAIVHSESAAIPQGVRKFLAAAAQKSETWLDGVVQFDFYDRDGPVTRSTDVMARHFSR